MKKIIKPITDIRNTQIFLTLSCTNADTITRILKMAIAENQTTYVLPGSGEAGLYFPPKPMIVATININACIKMTDNLYIKLPTLLYLVNCINSIIVIPLKGPILINALDDCIVYKLCCLANRSLIF